MPLPNATFTLIVLLDETPQAASYRALSHIAQLMPPEQEGYVAAVAPELWQHTQVLRWQVKNPQHPLPWGVQLQRELCQFQQVLFLREGQWQRYMPQNGTGQGLNFGSLRAGLYGSVMH